MGVVVFLEKKLIRIVLGNKICKAPHTFISSID